MGQEETDIALIRRIAEKDSAALEELYDRFEKPMYHFAYRVVKDKMRAEEVIQELFMKIWNNSERYDSSQAKVSTWMFTMTRNIAIDHLRKKGRRPTEALTEERMAITADASQDTEQEVENKLTGETLKKGLQTLKSEQQQVVELIYFQGLTQQEVADHHKVPLGTVKSRVRLALKNLKKKIPETFLKGGGEYE